MIVTLLRGEAGKYVHRPQDIRDTRVFLDGKPIEMCVYADDVKGEVYVIAATEKVLHPDLFLIENEKIIPLAGHALVKVDNAETHYPVRRLTGKVEIQTKQSD